MPFLRSNDRSTDQGRDAQAPLEAAGGTPVLPGDCATEPASRLLDCLVGANPIIWTNDDFPELGDATTLETCLAEMKMAGYAGAELGRKFPREAAALGEVLRRHELRLVSGWHSTYLANRPEEDEAQRFGAHLELLRALDARVVIVAECTRCIHGDRTMPLGYGDADRPRLDATEWRRVENGLARLTEQAAAAGLRVGYHQHMGTVVQSAAELDRLLGAVPALDLVFDPGHLTLAGIDPLAVLQHHQDRIAHVHLKSVRADVMERARGERWSFARAVSAGVFTIPGEGVVDFPSIFTRLAAGDYAGWLVVEAEEDPAQAPPLAKAIAARAFVRDQTGR